MPIKPRTPRQIFFSVLALLTLLFLGSTSYTLWRLHNEALERIAANSDLYAQIFATHLEQTFNAVQLTLEQLDAHATNEDLLRALENAPYLRSLSRLDGQGKISASSNPANLGQAIDQSAFLPATTLPGRFLRAAPPWIGRDFNAGRLSTAKQPAAANDLLLLPVLRHSDSPATAGSFLAAINPDYFLNYYEQHRGHPKNTVDILRYDNRRLLSTHPEHLPGSMNERAPDAATLSQYSSGRFNNEQDDSQEMLGSFAEARETPFFVSMQIDKKEAMASWQHEAWHSIATTLFLLLTTFAASSLYFFRYERMTRQRAADIEQIRLHHSALSAAANAIIITDKNGRIEWANPAFCRMTAYALSEVLGRTPGQLQNAGHQPKAFYQRLWSTILSGQVWRGEILNRRRDGSLYSEDQTITPVLDEGGEIRHFIAVKQDISERKEAERRVNTLSHQLINVQERARRRLAGELHDRTSPNLAALSIHLEDTIARLNANDTTDLALHLEDARALIEDTTASIRDISNDLRPPILDYAGLCPALTSHLQAFTRRTGVRAQLHCNDDARLPPAQESVLFRIVQEALTNCAKHAQASRIDVYLARQPAQIELRIEDDGAGFALEELGQDSQNIGLGILTVRDLTEFSGGSCHIDSRPGRGTLLRITLPLEGEPA
ncbi:PAS domain-containing protein [Azonexus sp.]|uniref:PAS domain-containing protein n=1 Tax=Azonexus sp. TaxID=1872668 RepID=UPI0039E38864